MKTKATSVYQESLNRRRGEIGGTEDLIQTPSVAVKLLLEVEEFKGRIWEMACGLGAISRVLEGAGHKVYSTDLYDHGYGRAGVDILTTEMVHDNIITNIPYSKMVEILAVAHLRYRKKMTLLLPLAGLGMSIRRAESIRGSGPTTVYLFTKKVPYVDREGNVKASTFPHIWVVWDKQREGGGTRLEWLRKWDKGEMDELQ